MPFTAVSLRLVALTSLLLAPATALGITFSTSDSQFDPGVDNQGYWRGSLMDDALDNYFVGRSGIEEHRNFFTFDLSGLPLGTDVVSAILRLTRVASSDSNETVETLEFFDVSTDAATLNENTNPNPAIFADLGSGTSYGAFDVPGDAAGFLYADVLEFVLNGSALADIEAAAGGFFSVGGVLTSDDGYDYLFGYSSSDGVQELVVEVIPEPSTGAMLLLGLLGLAGWRRGRD